MLFPRIAQRSPGATIDLGTLIIDSNQAAAVDHIPVPRRQSGPPPRGLRIESATDFSTAAARSPPPKCPPPAHRRREMSYSRRQWSAKFHLPAHEAFLRRRDHRCCCPMEKFRVMPRKAAGFQLLYVQCSFLLNTPEMLAPISLERHLHLIGQRKSMANPGINFRCAERGVQVDHGFLVPQLHPPTGKVVVGHPAGKGLRKRFPEPPMIVAYRIGFLTGNGKAERFPVHIPEQPSFCNHPPITSGY